MNISRIMDFTEKKVEIQKEIKRLLNPERYTHSLGVCSSAQELAHLYGCNVDKAAISALLHDVARDFSGDEMKAVILQEDPDAHFSRQMLIEPVLLHARAGAVVARNQFGINDNEILRGIALHTTGGPGMGLLERIVFVADFIEPGRRMRGVEEARKLASESLEAAMLYILKLVLAYLLDQDKSILSDSIDAYNDIILNRTN
jgi:predicted HD superfamily hydrolase involved in NAD metabolism